VVSGDLDAHHSQTGLHLVSRDCDPILHNFTLPPNSRAFEVMELAVRDLSLISDSNVVPCLQRYDDVEDVASCPQHFLVLARAYYTLQPRHSC
jgi:hypothetical protein